MFKQRTVKKPVKVRRTSEVKAVSESRKLESEKMNGPEEGVKNQREEKKVGAREETVGGKVVESLRKLMKNRSGKKVEKEKAKKVWWIRTGGKLVKQLGPMKRKRNTNRQGEEQRKPKEQEEKKSLSSEQPVVKKRIKKRIQKRKEVSRVKTGRGKETRGRGKETRGRGGWKGVLKEKKAKGRRHFRRGKPLKGNRTVKKARKNGVYGCGETRAKKRSRMYSLSERARIGNRRGGVVIRIERRIKKKRRRGPERKRQETEAIQKEYVRGTVRGRKMKRGLPVRGQRTSTNGKTARRLNRKRR